MDERWYTRLKWLVVALGAAWLAWSVYTALLHAPEGPSLMLETGHKMFADGEYAKALAEFRAVLATQPGNGHALRGVARSLMQLGQSEAAMAAFDAAIAAEPDFAAAHANRAILLDRSGRYAEALAGYERALELDITLDDGPGWLIRFLRNQTQPQSRLSERAAYLRGQLELPAGERLLRVPQLDAEQRAYEQ